MPLTVPWLVIFSPNTYLSSLDDPLSMIASDSLLAWFLFLIFFFSVHLEV